MHITIAFYPFLQSILPFGAFRINTGLWFYEPPDCEYKLQVIQKNWSHHLLTVRLLLIITR